MTSYTRHRCINCQMPYMALASGFPFGTARHTHSSYCEDCWEVASAALKQISPKRKKVWIEVVEPSLETMISRREERIRNARDAQEARRLATPKVMMGEPEYVGKIPERKPLMIHPSDSPQLLRDYKSFGEVDIRKVVEGGVVDVEPITFYIERCGGNLYDTTGEKGTYTILYDRIDGIEYKWGFWSKTMSGKVEKAMEEDVSTGDLLGPWKEYSRR